MLARHSLLACPVKADVSGGQLAAAALAAAAGFPWQAAQAAAELASFSTSGGPAADAEAAGVCCIMQ